MEESRKYLQGIREEIEKFYNEFIDEETEEEKGLFDYLADALDYEITIGSQRQYKSCKVWVTLGGPNVWIDTADHEINLAWGSDRCSVWLPSEICEEIDSYFEEFYNCR